MGDSRYKNAPTNAQELTVTEEWRQRVKAALARNKDRNRAAGISRDKKRPPDDHASLADAVGTDKTQIANILGKVKTTSRSSDLVDSSTFVRPISEVLGIDLPDIYADELTRMIRQLPELERQAIVSVLKHPERPDILGQVLADLNRRRGV